MAAQAQAQQQLKPPWLPRQLLQPTSSALRAYVDPPCLFRIAPGRSSLSGLPSQQLFEQPAICEKDLHHVFHAHVLEAVPTLRAKRDQ